MLLSKIGGNFVLTCFRHVLQASLEIIYKEDKIWQSYYLFYFCPDSLEPIKIDQVLALLRVHRPNTVLHIGIH